MYLYLAAGIHAILLIAVFKNQNDPFVHVELGRV